VGAVGIGSYAGGAWVLVLFAVGTTLETHAFEPHPPLGDRADGARAPAGARHRQRRIRAPRSRGGSHGYGATRIVVAAAFSATFHAWSELALALGWLAVLALAVAYVLRQLLGGST
jgi:hypothetical protein